MVPQDEPLIIPGWYEPDEDNTGNDPGTSENPADVIKSIDTNNLMHTFQQFYRKNYVTISLIQFLLITIILIKTLKAK